jgi:hypothetical protein
MFPGMAMFCVRIPDDLAARFDLAAAARGGRSARLRALIKADAGVERADVHVAVRTRSAARLMVCLDAQEAAHVDREAAVMGLRRAGWVAALVRRHASGRPTFRRADELALLAIQGEVHRIGINVNQIARALNTATLEDRVLDLQLSDLDALRRELRDHLHGLREAFDGNLAYWATDL